MTPNRINRLQGDPLLRMDERLDSNVGLVGLLVVLFGFGAACLFGLLQMPRAYTDLHVGYDVGEPASSSFVGSNGGEAGEGPNIFSAE